MYNIVVDYTHAHIEPMLPGDLTTRISHDLRYHPSGYRHTWMFKNKRWDGYNYLYDIGTQRFRTGLVWRVCLRFDRENVQYKITDLRKEHERSETVANIDLGNITPFEYQVDAALSTQAETHCIVASPTGTGKTIIMQLIARLHAKRTLVVVNSKDLLDQTHEAFDEVVPGGAGIVGAGDFELKDLTIATMQSLGTILRLSEKQQKKAPSDKEAPLRDWLAGCGVVIHDEVHEADNDQVAALYEQVKANRFIGTTATPFSWAQTTERGKNVEMEQHFGKLVFDSRGKVDFIKLGIVVPLFVQRIPMPQIQRFYGYTSNKKYPDDYNNVVQDQVIDNEARTAALTKKAREMVEAGMSCYVFYSRIKYGESLCEAMCDLDPVMLQGKTPRAIRKRTFKNMHEKKQLLVVSDIGGYGLNIRSLDSIMIASPTKDARQLKGRACRAFDGKERGFVLDPVDNVPFLQKHSDLRMNQYKKDNDMVIG